MSTLSTEQRDLNFLEACKTEECHVVRQFILSGCDPTLIRNDYGQNALHVASLHGNMDIAELLVKVYGCNPKITDRDGRNALHLACMGGSIVVTDFLIEKVDYSLTDNADNTLLHFACLSGNVPTVRYVILLATNKKRFRKLNIYRDKITIYTSAPNDSEFIALKNDNGETALHTACRAGHLNIIRCLVEELELNSCLCQILISVSKLACQYGRYDIFTYLVNGKCSHTKITSLTKPSSDTHFSCAHLTQTGTRPCQTKTDLSPNKDDYVLDCTSPFGFRDTYRVGLLKSSSAFFCHAGVRRHRYLLDNYREPFHTTIDPQVFSDSYTPSRAHPQRRCEYTIIDYSPIPSFKGDTFRASVLKPSLRFACQAGDEEMVRHLIEDYTCDPLVPDCDTGDTPLHSASISGNVSLVNFLLDCQCDPMKQNKQGNLPLHEACKWGNFEIAEKLIQAAPSTINASNRMMECPLHLACSRNRSHIEKLLVSIDSCDVMALNHLKETPLHVASCSSDYELIECILNKNKGALKCTDIAGDTPLFNACRVGNVDIIKLFVDTGCDPSHVNNKTHELPIHIACRAGNVALFQCLKIFMDNESWNQANIFGQTPLHLVCEQGSSHVVNDIFEHASCDLNLKDKRGMTPLHIACKKSNREITKIILGQPAVDVNIKDEDGNTPLHLACINENTDIVTLLMQNEPDVTIRNMNGDTPVHIVSKRGRFQILTIVLGTRKNGLKFEFNNAGVTPLHIASSCGHFEMVKYLVSGNYCDPNATSKQENCTPLHFACFEGHKDIATYLAECAPQTVNVFDASGRCSLLLALQRKNHELIESLVPQYFNPNSEASKDDIPLFFYACECGDTDLLKYLVSVAKCTPTVVMPMGDTPLHFIVQQTHQLEDIKKKFLYVLDVCSSQINFTNGNGDTPLLLACKMAKDDVVTLLLTHNANPNCKDSVGDTPLHIACRALMVDTVKHLLHFKADVSSKDSEGNTPLHVACKCMHREPDEMSAYYRWSRRHLEAPSGGYVQIRMLLDYKADIVSQNSDGDTPLHIASRSGITTFVKLLLDHRADTSCKNSKGKTPIQVTASYDVTMMLIDHGANPQDVYTQYGEVLEECKQEQPLHDMVKILIMGNALAGKTTLVEALKKESVHVALIDNVIKRTAGIVSTPFRSDKLGYVTFHDFAGQQEFYSSHSQFLVNNLSSDAIVLLLVNGLDEDSKLLNNISYWMSFIKHHCSNAEFLPQIVVICSHLDKLDSAKALKELTLTQAVEMHQCVGPVFLDCRNPGSEGMHKLQILLEKICKKVRSNIELDCQCHVLFAFMHSRFKDTVELGQVQEAIKRTRGSYFHHSSRYDSYLLSAYYGGTRKKLRNAGDLLPHAAPSLISLLRTLHQKGHILLLNNESQGRYWIVLKQDVFYETVHGILFAPKNFEDNGPIRTNVGVVPLSVLMEIFSKHRRDMKLITEYLVYKEFCHRIDDPEILQLISSETNNLLERDAELYFFPCFIKVEKQNTVWKRRSEQSYCSGWCLQCSDDFFETNFLHVLLLRLTFKYAVQHKDVPSTSLFIRRCDIWKNGIHWYTTDGVEVLVELTHNFTFLLVLIRSLDTRENVIMECVKLRASVIKTVFDVVEATCPGLKPSESLIHQGLHDYPDCDLMSTGKISIREVTETIKKGHQFSFSINSSSEPLDLELLLFFEPYSRIGEHLLALLYKNDEEEIPSNIVLELSQCFSSRKGKLECMLNASPVDMGDIKAHQVCQKNPELIPQRVIEHWKISTRRGSYSDLREAFDKYSIFKGRNPLTLCD